MFSRIRLLFFKYNQTQRKNLQAINAGAYTETFGGLFINVMTFVDRGVK